MDEVLTAPVRHRLDVDRYDRMAEAGIFDRDERIELIDGALIDMAPIGQGHEGAVNALTEALFLAFAGRAIVSPQNSLRLDRLNVPQPDFAVLRRRADFYATGDRPGPADVLLLVEVADSSLRYDRTVKLPLYARAGVPEYWIVDLPGRVVEAYRSPAGDRFTEQATHRAGDRIALAAMPAIVVGLDIVFA